MSRTVEDVYRVIGRSLLNSAPSGWERLEFTTQILSTACSGMMSKVSVAGVESSFALGFEDVLAVNDGLIFLRDSCMAETNRRIWGLAFTLYPDGKHKIEYDYSKPNDYDDSDDIITGDEINESLAGQLGDRQAASAMTIEQAYQAIGQCVLQAQGDSTWELGGVEIEYRPQRQVFMRFWQETAEGRVKAPYIPEQQQMVLAADAAYVLLDNLARDGGAVPSGLDMSLTPEGRMKLEYRYPGDLPTVQG